MHVLMDGRPEDVTGELEGNHPMNILYVCHRFPFPPKRGKIRPFNMIRHFSRSGSQGDGLLWPGQKTKRKRGRASRRIASVSRWPSSAIRFRHFGWLPGSRPRRHPHWLFLLLRFAAGHRCRAPNGSDSISSSCIVRRWPNMWSMCEISRILDFGDMDSQKWLEYGKYKAFFSTLTRLQARGAKLGVKKRLARRFIYEYRDDASRVGTLESYRAANLTGLVSQWRGCHLFQARR